MNITVNLWLTARLAWAVILRFQIGCAQAETGCLAVGSTQRMQSSGCLSAVAKVRACHRVVE